MTGNKAYLACRCNQVLGRREIQQKFARDLDLTSRKSSPGELRKFISDEQQRWARVIKSANITLN